MCIYFRMAIGEKTTYCRKVSESSSTDIGSEKFINLNPRTQSCPNIEKEVEHYYGSVPQYTFTLRENSNTG